MSCYICYLGKCNTQDELDSLCKEHENVRDDYLNTLFDSRCVVFKTSENRDSSTLRHINLNHNDKNYSKFNFDQKADSTNVSSVEASPEVEDSEISIDRDSGVFDAHNTEMSESLREHSPTRTLQLPLDTTSVSLIGSTSATIDVTNLSQREHSMTCTPLNSNSDSFTFLSSSIPSPTHLGAPVVDDSPSCMSESSNGTPSPTDHSSSSAHTPTSQKSDCSSDSSSHHAKPFLQPHSRKTTVLYYQNQQESMQLEQDLYDFICSLFWVLESKRLDRSHEKLDRLPMMFAPFEKKDYVGLDLESR